MAKPGIIIWGFISFLCKLCRCIAGMLCPSVAIRNSFKGILSQGGSAE